MFFASLGVGLLLKSLVAIVFPIAAGLLFLAFTRQLLSRKTWKRLHPIGGNCRSLVNSRPMARFSDDS